MAESSTGVSFWLTRFCTIRRTALIWDWFSNKTCEFVISNFRVHIFRISLWKNLKFCFIKKAHRRTSLDGLWIGVSKIISAIYHLYQQDLVATWLSQIGADRCAISAQGDRSPFWSSVVEWDSVPSAGKMINKDIPFTVMSQ